MARNKGVVRFHVLEPFHFPGKKKVKEAISHLMIEEKKPFLSLDYIFCSDEYLLEINKHYLKHDDLTDILTFDLSDGQQEIIGEIYISVERVRDNSVLFNTSFNNEFCRVIFHGALHLCGYGDKTNRERELMREKENYYLAMIF